jgi:hypothetical protein
MAKRFEYGWEAVGSYLGGSNFLFKRELPDAQSQGVQRPRPPASWYDVSR